MRIYYSLIIALLALCLAWPLAAQEDDVPPTAESAEVSGDGGSAVEEDEDEDEDEEEVDDSDLDEQTYEGEDDDFVPTQEIPADSPIPFPSNI